MLYEVITGKTTVSPEEQEQARAAALKTYEGGYNAPGESQDIYLARTFPQFDDAAWESLEAYTGQLLVPLYQACQEVEA